MNEESAFTLAMTAEELRALGALVEKQLTTPEYYPLTLNALVAACNQKNNRDPVVGYSEETVARALDRLRDRRLVSLVSTAGGRTPKYKHLFPETYGLDARDTAILCELMLRGPQTAAELRARAERMGPIGSVEDVQAALNALAQRPQGPLVVRLPRQPGQKEARYAHLLGEPPNLDQPAPPPEPATVRVREDARRLDQLESDVAALRQELAALREQFEAFRKTFE